MAELVGDKGQVLAFEPDPRIFESKLVPLQQIYPWVSIYPVALADRAGIERFNLDAITALSSFLVRPRHNMHVVDTLEIQTITLDDVMSTCSVRDLSFVKIDVEGAELRVLEGAKQTAAKYHPLIAMEIDWPLVFNIDPTRYAAGEHERETQQFLGWLEQFGGGYSVFDFFGHPIANYDPEAWNIVLAPDDFDIPVLREILSESSLKFFRDFRDWSLY